MGRSESGTSGAAIAVIVIGGIFVVLLLGCAGLGAMSFFFMARSSPPPQVAYPTVVSESAPVIVEEEVGSLSLAPRVVSNNIDGVALVDGEVYTDEALRELLTADAAAGDRLVLLELTPDLAADRRTAIEEIVAAAAAAAPTSSEIVEPFAPTE